jgi:hypothetical protein
MPRILFFSYFIGAFLFLKQTYNQTISHKPFAKKYSLFAASLLLGIAFLYKIVAIFDFVAFLTFFGLLQLPEKTSWSLSLIIKLRKK